MKILSYICIVIKNNMTTVANNLQINKEKFEKAAYILKAVAHPTRLAIIQLLDQDKNLSVNEICDILDCEQSIFISPFNQHEIAWNFEIAQRWFEYILLTQRA